MNCLTCESLPFDNNSNTFCLRTARDHTEFMLMSHHKKEMKQYNSQVCSSEKDGAINLS